MNAYDSWTIEKGGRTYRVSLEYDGFMGAPWEEHDTVAVVEAAPSTRFYGWNAEDGIENEYRVEKLSDRYGEVVYVDLEASEEQARKWGIHEKDVDEAVWTSIESCRRWVENEWHWTTVRVERKCECCDSWEANSAQYLGGIESDAEEYIRDEAAHDLIAQLEHEYPSDNEEGEES